MTNQNYNTTVRTAPAVTPGTGVTQSATPFNPGKPSNLSNNIGTRTENYFNNFFVKSDAISVQANDSIVGYFEQQTQNRQAALVLAQAVINTATQQGDDPMRVLDEFKKLPQGELDGFLALYLNTSRVSTSLLGVKQPVAPNKHVARTILP